MSMSKEILLVNLPAIENTYNFALPFGPASIADVLENIGCQVDVWDLNIEGLTRSETEAKIAQSEEYRIIGVSGLITTYNYLRWFIPLLRKKLPQAQIIIGGGISSEASDLLLEKNLADFVVIGEGENTIRELIIAIFEKKPVSNIKGIGYLEYNQLYFTSARDLIKDIDNICFPSFRHFDLQKYMLGGAKYRNSRRTLTVITSRGCPYNCNFCYHIFGRKYRRMSNARIIEELLRMKKKYSPDLFSFSDELFVANKEKIIKFCEEYTNKNIAIPWWCKSRVDTVYQSMFRHMKNAGCEAVGFGFESGSQKILDNMNKKTTIEQMARAIKTTRGKGMKCGGSFMIGYPGETKKTIKDTVKFCKRYSLKLDGLYYATPYPGTQLYYATENIIMNKFKSRENFIKQLGDTREFVVNLTNLSDDEIIMQHDKALSAINSENSIRKHMRRYIKKTKDFFKPTKYYVQS